ncbi:MAG: hypothetical protein JWM44_2217 [Bacilli bacterium]|jgi:hypothetical protein|nr:hypothetical protein [Bacilli bacterium]
MRECDRRVYVLPLKMSFDLILIKKLVFKSSRRHIPHMPQLNLLNTLYK